MVLLEDEHRTYEILRGLGVHDVEGLRMLCRLRTAYEDQLLSEGSKTVFVFETFGFFTRNPKLDQEILAKDGVIVVLDYATVVSNVHKVTERLQSITCRPLLVLIENSPEKNLHRPIVSTSQATFRVEYIPKNGKPIVYNDDFYGEKIIQTPPRMSSDTMPWFEKTLIERPKANGDLLTSRTIKSTTMMAQFENETLPLSIWDHYGRLRIVYLSLKHYGYENTIDINGWLCKNWKTYKTSIGHGHLWNYTLTRLWVDHIKEAILRQTSMGTSGVVKAMINFDDLYTSNPILSNGKLHEKYYTGDVLFSSLAKNTYVPPNLIPEEPKAGETCVIF